MREKSTFVHLVAVKIPDSSSLLSSFYFCIFIQKRGRQGGGEGGMEEGREKAENRALIQHFYIIERKNAKLHLDTVEIYLKWILSNNNPAI